MVVNILRHRAWHKGLQPVLQLLYILRTGGAGWQGDAVGALHCAPLASTYLNMRKTTIYGGSNEVQRNIVSQGVLG